MVAEINMITKVAGKIVILIVAGNRVEDEAEVMNVAGSCSGGRVKQNDPSQVKHKDEKARERR